MKQYDILETKIIGCIIDKFELIKELYVDEKCFLNVQNRRIISFFKKMSQETKEFDVTQFAMKFPTEEQQNKFIDYVTNALTKDYLISQFYEYQNTLQEAYRDHQLDEAIKEYEQHKLNREDLVERIQDINSESLYLKHSNKKTPKEMLSVIRSSDRKIEFNRFKSFNSKIVIKQNTVNIIAARPSEGKSALALNLMCDLSKTYKCLYFNMEMTEAEVYERMLGIETGIPMEEIRTPVDSYQNSLVNDMADKIYNYDYEVVNGSKSIRSIKSKIIREQRDSHLIVFIDYVGYVTSRYGMSDKDRIGEITRELNNLTKDYDCTIFIIAQINRNGAETPTMEDLKDSGELEQSADTIILIHDPHKDDKSDTKEIQLLIPKCRGSKRNIYIKVDYLKKSQRMEDFETE